MVFETRSENAANFSEVGMMTTISIWGSTGIIGAKAMKIAIQSGYRVVAIVGNTNHKLLIEQAKTAHPGYVGVAENTAYTIARDNLHSNDIKVLPESGFNEIAQLDVDCCVMAISGNASLVPTFKCLGHAKRLAIATKEAIISGGKLLQDLAKQQGTEIIPIDSEHNSIFQCLQGENINAVQELILTASGGAFVNLEENELAHVTVQDALKHPNWNMGVKNTIDSATLINKALEIIEASYLFDMDVSKIKAVIHPNSIIHAMVKFSDNSYKTLMSYPDMNLPISHAINYPHRIECELPALNFEQIGTLQFKKPKEWQKRNIKLAYYAVAENKSIAFNIANEIAVNKFVHRELKFAQIYDFICDVLACSPAENVNSYGDICAAVEAIHTQNG